LSDGQSLPPVEPDAGQSISRILQALTVAHTWHYHRMRATTGHVWQGRFKSSPVISTEAHLLTVMRYVESNPLRPHILPCLKPG
jgi:putative transposase